MANGSIFDVYFDYIRDSSEAPFIFHRWSFIVGVGALLGRNVSFPFGHETLYPNMYAVLLGPSASRKSSAIKVARTLLEAAGYNTFAKDKSSKEKFISDLAHGFGPNRLDDEQLEQLLNERFDDPDPHEVLISASELEDFLGARDSGLISMLTNLYDNPDFYENPKMNGKNVYVPKPTVSMIGGATPTTFATTFPPEVIGQGFLSRTPLIHADGPRTKITIPPLPDPHIGKFLVDTLQLVKQNIRGEMKYSKEAFKIFDDVYKSDFPVQDSRLVAYAGRRHTHFYKLAMVCAALDLSMTIEAKHAIEANSILHYTELQMPKALGEFGTSMNSGITHTTLKYIQGNPKGVTIIDVMKANSSEYKDIKECGAILHKLRDAGKIESRSGKLFAVDENKSAVYPHVDFTLLAEYTK